MGEELQIADYAALPLWNGIAARHVRTLGGRLEVRGKREIRLTTLIRLLDAFGVAPEALLQGLIASN
jgi:hypothetical protein